MVNICEPSINVVTCNKPKRLIGLGQKGTRTGIEVIAFSITGRVPPAKRRDLTLSLIIKRNVLSLYLSLWESEP